MNASNALRPGDRVTLNYRLSSYGQLIADTFGGSPETFRLGDGDIDARLESVLVGLDDGTHRVFELMPWQAFGERDEANIQTLGRNEFPPDVPLTPGHQVDFDLPNGQNLVGTIVAAGPETVVIDFNHPLAGLPIEFEVQILAIEHA